MKNPEKASRVRHFIQFAYEWLEDFVGKCLIVTHLHNFKLFRAPEEYMVCGRNPPPRHLGTALGVTPQVKYGVRSPKFFWAPCAQLYSLAETPHPPPPAFVLIYEGAIGQQR